MLSRHSIVSDQRFQLTRTTPSRGNPAFVMLQNA
jgi:hypothetical protein